jgi:hypothetical protein
MTAPIRPAPKSLDGRSARELYAYERTVDDGEEALPPATGAGGRPPVVPLPVFDGGLVRVLLEQPAGATDYSFKRPVYDASWATQARLIADIETAGHTAAELYAEYSTDGVTWVEPGVSAAEVAISLAQTGPVASLWVNLATGARADRMWRVWARGGNGTLSPVVAKVHIQFRIGTTTPLPPTSSAGCTTIHKLNGMSLGSIYTNGDPVLSWPDEGPLGYDATTVSGVLPAPVYEATGFPGGLPCVSWPGGNTLALRFTPPTNDSFTHYMVVSDIDGGDFGGILSGDGYPFGKGIFANETQLGAHVNTTIWGNTFVWMDDDWDMSAKHIYRFVFNKRIGHWWLFVDGVLKGDHECNPQYTATTEFLIGSYSSLAITMKLAYEECCSEVNSEEGYTAKETALKATWGTP